MITFLVSGLWHGANWTFVAWGAVHGFYYLFSHWTAALRRRLASLFLLDRHPLFHRAVGVVITFLLVSLAWVFFVSRTLGDALYVFSHLFTGYGEMMLNPARLKDVVAMNMFGLDHIQLGIALLSILFVEIVYILEKPDRMRAMFSDRPVFFRWGFYYGVIMGTLFFGVFDNMKSFIYFQF